MDDRLEIIISADPAKAQAGFQAARKEADKYDTSLENLLSTAARSPEVFTAYNTETVKTAQRFKQLVDSQGEAVRSTQKFTGSGRQAEDVLFSLGYLINDAQQATYGWSSLLRATSNNVSQLVLRSRGLEGGLKTILASLKGPAGLILAFEAVSTAAVLFADKAEDSLDRVGTAAENTIKRLEEASGRVAGGLTQQQRLDAFLKVQQEITRQKKEEGGADLRLIELEKRLREALGDYLKEVELVNALRELGVEIAEKEKKKRRESLDILEQEVKRTKELRETVRALAGEGAERLARQESLNRALQQEIEHLRLIGRLRAGVQRVEPRGQARGVDTGGVAPELQEGAQAGLFLRRLTDGQIEELGRLRDANKEALDQMQTDWASYLTGNVQGLQLLQEIGETTFGGFADLSRAAYDLSGQKAFFAGFKALSIAQAIVSTYTAANVALASAPPPFNYFLAAGVVAAGLANVARIRAAQPGSQAGGGGGGGGTSAPFVTISPGARRLACYRGEPPPSGPDLDSSYPDLDSFYAAIRRSRRRPASPALPTPTPQLITVQVTGELISRRGTFHAAITEDAQRVERLLATT